MTFRPDPRAGAAFDAAREFLRKPWVQYALRGIAGVVAFAIVISVAWRWVLSDDASAPETSETRAPIGEGSPAALPFGRGSATSARDGDPATVDVSGLRAAYLTNADRHAFWRATFQRPEPEAKYLAWRAASDCAGALRHMEDAAELEQTVRDAIAREGGGPEQTKQRLQAATQLRYMCGGFLRPGSVPHGDMHRLLSEAAAANHPAAAAAQRTPSSDLASLVTKAVQSGDALAFSEAAPALARLAFTHRIAGVEATPQTVFAIQLAVDAAACRVSGLCGPGSVRALSDCVHGAACEMPSIADHVLDSPMLGANAALARKLAADIDAAVRRRDAAALIGPRR